MTILNIYVSTSILLLDIRTLDKREIRVMLLSKIYEYHMTSVALYYSLSRCFCVCRLAQDYTLLFMPGALVSVASFTNMVIFVSVDCWFAFIALICLQCFLPSVF